MKRVQMSGLRYPAVRRVLDLCGQGGWAAIQPAGRGGERGDRQDRGVLSARLQPGTQPGGRVNGAMGRRVPVRTKARLSG